MEFINIGGIFFFQNNQILQTISLVSKVLKLFSNLTNRVQKTRFCCAKLSVKRSSSELESPRLDFLARLKTSLDQRTRKHRDGGNAKTKRIRKKGPCSGFAAVGRFGVWVCCFC